LSTALAPIPQHHVDLLLSTLSRDASANAYEPFLRSNRESWSSLIAGHEPWLASEVSLSPALHLVAVFNYRIHSAALLIGAAFQEAAVTDFKLSASRHSSVHRHHVKSTLYSRIVDDCLDRSRDVRNALVHSWHPTPRAERLAIDAFVLLTDLTPARTELLRLCRYDRSRAFSELAKHIDLATDQFRLSADLLSEVDRADQPVPLGAEQHFSEVSARVLEDAGGGLSLTEGAKLVGSTRQALHKRVKLGSALGMMHGSELVLPKVQFVSDRGKTRIVAGLASIVKLFDRSKAGRWSALQFLVGRDPNLADTPIHALVAGRVDEVANAANAYLGTGEA
jgi:predicted transcriptional regulator